MARATRDESAGDRDAVGLNRRSALKFLGAGGAGAALLAMPSMSADAAPKPARRLSGEVSPFDHGAVGDGKADDTDAVKAALRAATGRAVVIEGSFLVTDDITVPAYTAVRGLGGNGVYDGNLSMYDVFAHCSIVLGGNATINLSRGAVLESFALLRSGLLQPADSIEKARTMVGQFRGTAITSRGFEASDLMIREMSIFGHSQAVDIDGSDPRAGGARTTITDTRIDCTAGVLLKNLPDVCRLNRVHCWPFTTYFFGNVSSLDSYDLIERSGVAFTITGTDDFAQLIECFSYGYNHGVVITDAGNIQLINHAVDNVQIAPGTQTPRPLYRNEAIVVQGSCQFIRIIESCVFSHPTAIKCDVSGPSADLPSLIVTGGAFVCFENIIELVRGNAHIASAELDSGQVGVDISATMGYVSCDLVGAGGHLAPVGTVYRVAKGHASQLRLGVPLYVPADASSTQPSHNTAVEIADDVLRSGRVTVTGDVGRFAYTPQVTDADATIKGVGATGTYRFSDRQVHVDVRVTVPGQWVARNRRAVIDVQLPLVAAQDDALVATWRGGNDAWSSTIATTAHGSAHTQIRVPTGEVASQGGPLQLRIVGEYELQR